MSDDEFNFFKDGEMIGTRWKVVTKLGEGGFGAVYEVFDTKTQQSAAMKSESSLDDGAVLKLEKAILCQLQGRKHVCRFIGSGRQGNVNYIVMSLVGKSLAELRRETKLNKFSLRTTIFLAKQCVEAVEDMHSIGYVHRDLKPGNFALGRHAIHKKTVIMLDYGLARRFIGDDGVIRSPRGRVGFRGTIRYASINTHKNIDFGRVDDLWCLYFMFIEMLRGVLPWKHFEDKGTDDYKDDVGKMKEEMPLSELLKDCPMEFIDIHSHLTRYGYVDKPDYVKVQTTLDKIIINNSIKPDDPLDWEPDTRKPKPSSLSALKRMIGN